MHKDLARVGARLTAQLGQRGLDLSDEVFVEDDLIEDVPEADALFSNDGDQTLSTNFCRRILIDLILEEL